MVFKSDSVFRLVNVRNVVSKKGNNLSFVTIANTQTFENADFILDFGLDPSVLVVGSDYYVTINTDGRFTTVSLESCSKR